MSWLLEIGMIPDRPISPTVGLMPTSEFTADGAVTEPSVSLPTATAQKFAASRCAGAGARARWIAIQRIGIMGQPAAPAPSADRMRRPEIGPLAQIGLAQDDGAGRAQPLRDEGIARGDGTQPRPAIPRWSSCGRPSRCCP